MVITAVIAGQAHAVRVMKRQAHGAPFGGVSVAFQTMAVLARPTLHRNPCWPSRLLTIAQRSNLRRLPEQVASFGSHANGLAAHSSDIDVVILGLVEPDAGNGGTCDAMV